MLYVSEISWWWWKTQEPQVWGLVQWPTAIIRPKSQNSNVSHDGILSIWNFMLMINNHYTLFQLPGNLLKTKKCAPYFCGNTEFPIYSYIIYMRNFSFKSVVFWVIGLRCWLWVKQKSETKFQSFSCKIKNQNPFLHGFNVVSIDKISILLVILSDESETFSEVSGEKIIPV
jgi:hypothetical protein